MKKLIRRYVRVLPLCWVLLSLLNACITPYQPDTVSSTTALVVEGLITDQSGPYTVKLTRTADYSLASLNALETGAQVTIIDTLGNQEMLKEQTAGSYATQKGGLQGRVGHSYKLRIQTQDGTHYESDWERLRASPPIDRLYYEYQYDPTALTNDKANLWNVFLDTKDPSTLGDFYRWEWTHYNLLAYCGIEPGTETVGISCCSNCWAITHCYINCFNIHSDMAINGHAIARQPITQIVYDGSTPYYLEVKQQLLSAGVYNFFKRAAQLVANSGGLFDSAPSNVGGNIHAINKPTAVAYGYFGAVGEAESVLLVDRGQAQGLPVYIKVDVDPFAPCIVCENSAYRTSTKPRWWPN